MIACNFLFDFIPKELLYVKNNSSKYELNLTAGLRVLCSLDGDKVTEIAVVICKYMSDGVEGLMY
jgi:hypothetical protein